MRIEPYKWDVCPYKGDPGEVPCPLCQTEGGRLQNWKVVLIRGQPHWHLISDLQPSELREINLLLQATLSMVFC